MELFPWLPACGNQAPNSRQIWARLAIGAPSASALGEAVVFLNHFKDLPDPRQPGKVNFLLSLTATTHSRMVLSHLKRLS
jgi:hypothetical protein